MIDWWMWDWIDLYGIGLTCTGGLQMLGGSFEFLYLGWAAARWHCKRTRMTNSGSSSSGVPVAASMGSV